MTTPDTGRATVFVVDDDAAVAASLGRLLALEGWPVEVHLSAEAFLGAHEEAPEGVLVLDVCMPGISGPELQSRLRAQGASLPTIFISAVDDPRVRDEALRDGGRAWLPKPVDAERLIATIRGE
jgi:FixJ family two-component response regulator